MEMEGVEIVSSYKNAANRNKQIQILADLNACTKKDITELLEAAGISVPKRKYSEEEKKIMTVHDVIKEPESVLKEPKNDIKESKNNIKEPKNDIKKPETREQTTVVLNETVALILFGRLDEIEARLRILESQKKKLEGQYLDICKCLGVAKKAPCEDFRGPGM
nr:MAG TPA: hypothetical protein [Caudoviricetes sp.]